MEDESRRMAKVLGSEYDLTPTQVAKLSLEETENQDLMAREFRAENKKNPTEKPGEMGKRIGNMNKRPIKPSYFKEI